VTLVLVWVLGGGGAKNLLAGPLACARGIGTGFVIFGDYMNILQVSKVKVVDTPIVDTRLVLN
jgi:hypothetical protein